MPFHIRLILCFQQAGEIHSLIISLGQSSLIVLCASSMSGASFRTFYEFKKAPHPDIMNTTFPCPSDWKFSEGEHVVVIKPSEKQGIIKAVHP